MPETNPPHQSSLSEQIKSVMRDGVDHFSSSLLLLQARFTEMALTSTFFVGLVIAAAILGFVAFVILSIALGVWLSHVLGSVLWSLLVIGLIYVIFSGLCLLKALKWLNRLKS